MASATRTRPCAARAVVTEQLTFDARDGRPAWVSYTPLTLTARWWDFHAHHPEVYDHLVRLARRARRRGSMHLGISMLWETMRYRSLFGASVPNEDIVRLNNNHRAYYARYIMETCPDLAGAFEIRELGARDA